MKIDARAVTIANRSGVIGIDLKVDVRTYLKSGVKTQPS